MEHIGGSGVRRIARTYESLLMRLLDVVVQVLAIAIGIRWTFVLLEPVVPFLIGGAVLAVVVTMLRYAWRRHRDW
jgi:uncharacterized membrane protein AbrB (regulator of aidB expression)